VVKNEDTFSVQIIDQAERLCSFLKEHVKSVIHENTSLMPIYTEQMLSDGDLQDVVAYLSSLRGTP
jgi:hemerythrin-like domain-containing protein